MSKRRRGASLADEIADLLDTRPADPTGDEELHDAADDDGPRELLADADRPVAMGRRRMRGSGSLDLGEMGDKYAGKVVSRATVESREHLRRRPDEAEHEEDDISEEGEEEDMDEEDDNSSEGEDASEMEDEEREEDGEEDEIGGEQSTDHEEDEDEEEDQIADEAGGLYGQWASAQAEETELLSQLKSSQQDELGLAKQAMKQRTALLQMLQLRMHLQPAMVAAARLPSAGAANELWRVAGAKARTAAKAVATEAAATLTELCIVREATMRKEGQGAGRGAGNDEDGGEEEEEEEEAGRRLRLSPSHLASLGTDMDKWWTAISTSQESMWGWVETAIDEISAELPNSGTASVYSAGGAPSSLKAVRQGPLTQCEHLFAQLPAGSEARDQACHLANERVLGTVATGQESGGSNGNGTSGQFGPGEVYDDGPFYHSLIKELLNDDGTGGAGGTAVVGSGVKLKRVKRPTDNRMSKGRRLSFEVQPKLCASLTRTTFCIAPAPVIR